MTDLRAALRSLMKARGFTAAVVLTLGVGIALSTTATAVFRAYLLDDLPYPHADRLYWIRYDRPGAAQPRDMEALDWSSLDDVLEHRVAWDLDVFFVLGGEGPDSMPGAWVTAGFLDALGVRPAFGRSFDAGAFLAGSPNQALISHRFWATRFGSDPAAVGRTFTAYVSDRPEEAETFTIVGVLPASFWHLNPYTDILTPLRAPTYPYMARLREGVTPQRAAARVTALVTAGGREVAPRWEARLVSSHAAYTESIRPVLRAVTGAAVLVLLVACGNVAGLLLVRATRRQKELAIRAALGGTRGAMTRLLLAEAFLLGAGATLLGLAASALALSALSTVVQQQIGRPAPGGADALVADPVVGAFAAGLGALTVLLCTAVPLLQGTRRNLLGALSLGGSRTATETGRSRRIRSALIALEIAVSLTLLVGSALMVQTTIGLLHTDLGFEAEGVTIGSVTLRQNQYPDASARTAVLQRMLARLESAAGVESAAFTNVWPAQQPQPRTVSTAASQGVPAGVHAVGGEYLRTLRVPLRAGRTFDERDRATTQPVVLVSETLARRLWPAGAAVGRRLAVPQAQEGRAPVMVDREVVGVVADVRQEPSDSQLADAYLPLPQAPGRSVFLLVRAEGPASAIARSLRTALRDVDPEMALNRPGPLKERVDALIARPRFLASLLTAFAAVAAALALVGVYGVVAYAVRQREREIAVRMALGADARHVVRVFVRQGAAILGTGLAAGLLAAAGAGRLIESQLFGTTPHDPVALGAAAAAFAGAGLFAVWWPSRRAAATDPAVALRAE